jgi:DNA-binding NtrC family response regulator
LGGALKANRYHKCLGTSQRMQEVFAMIRKVATTGVPALILGESATGNRYNIQYYCVALIRKDSVKYVLAPF